MSTSPTPARRERTLPAGIAIPIGHKWLIATALISVILYYFIGVDQGAASVLGNDMHIHEFVHDARHFLGFPCH